MNIITGYTGEQHITSDQDRDANQGSYGTGSYILDVGAKMAATIVSANEVRIADGVLSHQGCVGNIDKGQYESCAIANGSQGMKRNDLIVCRYEKDSETNVESLSLVVIQGTPTASTPSDPSYNSGDIQSGASPVDFPLYRVNINGITVSSVTRLAPYVRTQKEMDTLLGNTSISGIGNGTVTGAISELNSRTGAIRFLCTINPNIDYGGIAIGFYDKSSKTVRIVFYFSASINVNENATLFTIPDEYAPSANYGGVCTVTLYNGTTTVCGCGAYSNKTIRHQASSAADVRRGMGFVEYPL